MSKKKNLGVPVRKASPSRVARVPSPKKATASRRSTRSRGFDLAPQVQIRRSDTFGEWIEMPFRDTAMVVMRNEGRGLIPVSLLLTHQLYVRTVREIFREHPATRWITVVPVNSEKYVDVTLDMGRPRPAIAIGGAATKEPVRRTGAKRTTGKRRPKASPTKPPRNSTTR